MAEGATAAASPPRAAPANERLPGLVFAFRFHEDGSAEEIPADQPISDAGGWLWLHFNLTDPRCRAFLNADIDLPREARELLAADEEHQQLQADGACIYGIFADLVCGLGGATDEIGFLHFAMTDKLLVSARRHKLNAVEATRRALKGGLRVQTVATLLEAIVEHVVDAVDRFSDGLADDLDRVEESLLVDQVDEARKVLGRVRRTTVRLHRQLLIMRALMHRFETDIRAYAKPALKLATKRLLQRLEWLDSEIVALRDRSQLLQEESALKIAEQTNQRLQVLAVLSTVFLPATLVTGIFGMNVKDLPFTESSNGFFWAMVLVVGASAIVLWLLKRSGILGR